MINDSSKAVIMKIKFIRLYFMGSLTDIIMQRTANENAGCVRGICMVHIIKSFLKIDKQPTRKQSILVRMLLPCQV